MRHAVILAGGGGTRLWPASRRALPKQFLTLGTGPVSLLTSTANRLASVCEDRLYVVTAADQVEQVQHALPKLSHSKIIAEPSARNTAAALGLSAVHLLHRDPDAIMAAIPSDQHIGDEEEFRRVLSLAFATAETEDAIVTVGIVPTRPETGYGYLKLGAKHSEQVSEVAEFVEKPDSETAQKYLDSGEYLWNGGMFITKAARLLSEIERLMPETYKGLKTIADAMSEGRGDEVCARVYPELPSISIDYGVMEKTSPVLTIAGDFQWNDVGSWSALPDYRDADSDGNVILGTAITHDASNNILVGDPDNMIAVAGISNMVVVQSGNAVLVLPRDRVQDVRALVQAMRDGELDKFL